MRSAWLADLKATSTLWPGILAVDLTRHYRSVGKCWSRHGVGSWLWSVSTPCLLLMHSVRHGRAKHRQWTSKPRLFHCSTPPRCARPLRVVTAGMRSPLCSSNESRLKRRRCTWRWWKLQTRQKLQYRPYVTVHCSTGTWPTCVIPW